MKQAHRDNLSVLLLGLIALNLLLWKAVLQ